MRLSSLLLLFGAAACAQGQVANEASEATAATAAPTAVAEAPVCYAGADITSQLFPLLQHDSDRWTKVQWSSYRGVMSVESKGNTYCPYDFTVKNGVMSEFTAVPQERMSEGYVCTSPPENVKAAMQQLTIDQLLQEVKLRAETASLMCWDTHARNVALTHTEACAAGVITTCDIHTPSTPQPSSEVLLLDLDVYQSVNSETGDSDDTRLVISNMYKLPDERRLGALRGAAVGAVSGCVAGAIWSGQCGRGAAAGAAGGAVAGALMRPVMPIYPPIMRPPVRGGVRAGVAVGVGSVRIGAGVAVGRRGW